MHDEKSDEDFQYDEEIKSEEYDPEQDALEKEFIELTNNHNYDCRCICSICNHFN